MVFRLQAQNRRFLHGRSLLSYCAFAAALAPARASADEPRLVTEPLVMREPAEIVQVADAFDDSDPFDLHLSLGYQSTWTNSRIYRENAIRRPGLTTGGFTTSNLNVAKYEQHVTRLNTRADIGLYKDIALIVRMPVILSDNRELKGVDGSGSAAQQTIALRGAPGEQLFSLPFKSPTRSGIEYLALGLDFGLMNQARDATKPTWVLGFEGRFDIDEPMHACNANPASGQVKCADPGDIDRDGTADGGLEGDFSGSRKPGVSRGVTALEGHVYLSRRVKYIEPYGGFRALFEFQNGSSDYGQTDLQGSLVNHPPFRGTMLVGVAIMPYEVRDQFQRLTVDLRFEGTYVSEGRDYSELFDALGSSPAYSMRSPQFAEYQGAGGVSVVNPGSQRVYMTGITDVQQHGVYTFSASVAYQAAEYVKFNVGGSYTLVQSHFITFDQACNPDFDNDASRAGPCISRRTDGSVGATGIPNPNYRKVINDPGQRFKVDDASAFDAWVSATVMF
jgi:hypothetical protein